MSFQQKIIQLKARNRGFHLIDSEIESTLLDFEPVDCGILFIQMMHTSASLTLNENADPTVRQDFESHFNKMVPENMPYYLHTYEGSDDMPAHLKAALLGFHLQIPVQNQRLVLGTWQGVYLGEHRDRARSRSLCLTLQGE